ncbi:hypothetical protein YTPLAS18_05540 [Nitrospira sp.]|nr:hypothetical protein YTPLAS18_05540 [Nitrospira sp.]
MPGILSKIRPDVQKRHKLDKPHLKKLSIAELKSIARAVVESRAKAGGTACQTCCCCCAVATEVEVVDR